jgi:hypothetical protein
VTLRSAGDADSFKLRGFSIRVALSPVPGGGTKLVVSSSAKDMDLTDEYDFGQSAFAAHLPSSGHGFTGLRYFSRAPSEPQLQYFCGAFAPGEDATTQDASQSHPGPASAPEDFARCDVSLVARDGTVEERRTVEVARPGGADARPLTLGPFDFGSTYVAGDFDSGGIHLSAGLANAGLAADLYQLVGTEKPANILSTSGFTGRRTITHATSGRALSYRCSMVRGS